jgi:serine-type D-Ala-D-Ala carboxypeptidase (penicillin-binding protein 5/6)
MTRPRYVSEARRRRRRRRLPWLVVALLIAVAAAVGAREWPGDDAPVTAGGGSGPVQLQNGPVPAPPGPRPLAVELEAGRDPVRVRFKHPPRSGLLFDLDTGQVLWRRAPERVRPIASLTKMMTALVVVGRTKPDDKVRITKEALAYRGSGVGVLPRGKRVKLETMLNGLLLPSGNDAAIALAQRTSGTVRNFVAAMNARARALGMRCTHYASPEGLSARNRSCAVDLAAQARAVLDEPRLARIVKRRRAVLPFPIKGGRLHIFSNNPLIRTGYPGILGIKTGYTRRAGRCLVAAASRGGRRLGVVLLDASDTGTQARQLLDRGFKWAARSHAS